MSWLPSPLPARLPFLHGCQKLLGAWISCWHNPVSCQSNVIDRSNRYIYPQFRQQIRPRTTAWTTAAEIDSESNLWFLINSNLNYILKPSSIVCWTPCGVLYLVPKYVLRVLPFIHWPFFLVGLNWSSLKNSKNRSFYSKFTDNWFVLHESLQTHFSDHSSTPTVLVRINVVEVTKRNFRLKQNQSLDPI